jgi:hypothetical protein
LVQRDILFTKSMIGTPSCEAREAIQDDVSSTSVSLRSPFRHTLTLYPCPLQYRITNAEHTIGVNAQAGAIYAMQLFSAAKAARRLWKRAPAAEELPAICSVSDIAWAFWNRVHADGGEGLNNVRYMFVTMIINKETNQHVKRALSTLSPPKEEVEGWPGHEFSMDSDAGKALLGSPVGRWAGYFLMQHKRQLGGINTSPNCGFSNRRRREVGRTSSSTSKDLLRVEVGIWRRLTVECEKPRS